MTFKHRPIYGIPRVRNRNVMERLTILLNENEDGVYTYHDGDIYVRPNKPLHKGDDSIGRKFAWSEEVRNGVKVTVFDKSIVTKYIDGYATDNSSKRRPVFITSSIVLIEG